MFEDGDRHDIFNPSLSWITKSGVHLEYTPEDTLTSAIFVGGENTLPPEMTYTLTTESCSIIGENKNVESQCNSKNYFSAPNYLFYGNKTNNSFENSKIAVASGSECQLTLECDGDLLNTDPKKPTNHPTLPKKPASFLRRRQGVSAWCSKLRRQGLPITDPAAELLRRQCTNSSQIPISKKASLNKFTNLQKTNSQPTSMSNDVSFATASPNGLPLNRIDESRKSNCTTTTVGNLKGVVVNDVNYNHNKEEESAESNLEEKSVVDHLPTKLMHSSINESTKEAIDLEEFELLEDLAETSSFSNLTNTSLLSKVNKISAFSRRDEKLSKEILKSDKSFTTCCGPRELTTNGKPGPHIQIYSDHIIKDSILTENKSNSNNKIKLHINETQNNNMPCNFNLPSSDNHCNVENILATPGLLTKECKITRFHTTKPSNNQIQSSSLSLASDRQLEQPTNHHQVILRKQTSSLPSTDDYDFDDSHSWSGDNSEINDTILVSGYNLADASLTDCGDDFANQPDELTVIRPTSTFIPNKSSTLLPCHRVTTIPNSLSNPSDACTELPETDVRHNQKFTSFLSKDAPNNTTDNTIVEQLKSEQDSVSIPTPCDSDEGVLKQWVSRLEAEVKRFKVENANLNKLKIEAQDSLRRIESEKSRFDENKTKVQKEFEEYKENEIRKLKKEKRVLEEYQRALRTMPNKKDREEIERLKQELEESRVDMGKREVRWHAALSRLRTRNEELETERDELKGRISRLEEERISLQAKLAKLQVTSNQESNSSKQQALRQTVNSISQSISLTPLTNIGGIVLKSSDDTHSQHSRQQTITHSSSPSSLASHPLISKLNKPGINTNDHKQNASSSTNKVSHDISQLYNENINSINNNIKVCQQESNSSITGTRESIASGGGYFTGDDDCISVSGGSSGRMVRLSSRSNNVANDDDNNVVAMNNDSNYGINEQESVNYIVKKQLVFLRMYRPFWIKTVHQNHVLYEEGNEDDCLYSNFCILSLINCQVYVISTNDSCYITTVHLYILMLNHHNSQLQDTIKKVDNSCHEKLPVPGTAASGTVIRSVKHTDGSVEQTYSNGAIVISYANGSVKEIFPDTVTIVVSLFNGDIKRTLPDGRVIYHYAADGTVQITFPDGTEEIQFSDGRHEIIHPNRQAIPDKINQSIATVNPLKSLTNEHMCQLSSNSHGDKEILFPNGQREIHSSTGIKCRIYPDGTMKTIFPDGHHETRYSSGRLPSTSATVFLYSVDSMCLTFQLILIDRF
ncbi:Centromere protein [Schistosoma japonicum]|uniref:Centromere protein n=1 Tax=Schistosoma japonicum TaxID=6182 RepID=A0A4Z2DFB6_SCHJA|nr:Centromere protein [Schistosoma japonicum]